MNLVALPAFNDNYIWMLHDGRQAVVVDPGDAAPVHLALDRDHLELIAILVTHHHPDHIGGVDDLRPRLRGHVWGPDDERIPAPIQRLRDGDPLNLLGQSWATLHVPGHTSSHLAYVVHGSGEPQLEAPLLFCGDTLFSAGCGRLFEGTPGQMWDSLSRLGRLPEQTRVCCAHEYTQSNLRFAASVEPGNKDIEHYARICGNLRAQGLATLPTTLSQEQKVNPFLRCKIPEVIQAAAEHGATDDSPASVLAALREWKNRFQ